MIVLFALGVMSLSGRRRRGPDLRPETCYPRGEALTTPFAVLLIGIGIWVAAAAGSVAWAEPRADARRELDPARARMMHAAGARLPMKARPMRAERSCSR